MSFGQIVVGPPGSGKTTYCNGMSQYMTLTGRDVAIVNLDPANDTLPYEAAVDIADLVDLATVQEKMGLGPNGGLVYCIDYLAENLDWLDEQLAPLISAGKYLLFDLPGQVELFTLHDSLKKVVLHLTKTGPEKLRDAPKYLAALLLSLNTMLHLELPHVNVLSKVDLIEAYGDLAFGLDYYCEVQDLSYLADTLTDDSRFSKRFAKLTRELCEVVEDFGLLSFIPLAIEDGAAVGRLLQVIDKTNGYAFAKMADKSPYPELEYGAINSNISKDTWLDVQDQYSKRSAEQQADAAKMVGSVVERST